MGGVGSFTRQNRTLYVGKIKEGRNTAETVENHFEEFGDIERSESTDSLRRMETDLRLCVVVRILQARGVAFVTYVSELNAQFAKEAMSNQSLDEGEVINVRSVFPFLSPSFHALMRMYEQMGHDGSKPYSCDR